jgi:pyridoxine 5'-phosphate synthase PdxJ
VRCFLPQWGAKKVEVYTQTHTTAPAVFDPAWLHTPVMHASPTVYGALLLALIVDGGHALHLHAMNRLQERLDLKLLGFCRKQQGFLQEILRLQEVQM